MAANYSIYVAKNEYHYSCRQTLQLCVGRVSPGYQCRYFLTHPAKIFKKTGTSMILICADYSVQVFKIRSVLCREQSGVYVAITMDQLLHNPPFAKEAKVSSTNLPLFWTFPRPAEMCKHMETYPGRLC